MRDMHSNIRVLHAITPQAVGTTGAANGRLSGVLDRRGFDTVEFVYSSGLSASAADTITPVVYECETTGGSFTSVADADLLGTEDPITLSAASTKSVGYRGNKPYLKLKLYGTGTATAIVSASAVLGKPSRAP
jgi:hypothetical protein